MIKQFSGVHQQLNRFLFGGRKLQLTSGWSADLAALHGWFERGRYVFGTSGPACGDDITPLATSLGCLLSRIGSVTLLQFLPIRTLLSASTMLTANAFTTLPPPAVVFDSSDVYDFTRKQKCCERFFEVFLFRRLSLLLFKLRSL